MRLSDGVKEKVISQARLTSDCWMVQFWGLSACQKCEFLGTDECGGEEIRRKIKGGEFPPDGLPDISEAL